MTEMMEKRQVLMDRMLHLQQEKSAPSMQTIPRRDPDAPVPLSFSQERLWFLDKLAPGNPFYVESTALRIPSYIDPRALERAIRHVAMRHDVLRARIYERDGRPLQVALPSIDVPLIVTDLSSLQPAEQEREVERIALEQAVQPFALEEGPLFRARLLKLGYANHVFLIALHHIVTDGWSMTNFHREMSTAYQAFANGRPVYLPELRIQYFDYAVWQRQSAQAEWLATQLDYWRQQLRDLTQLALPLDHPRPRVLAFRGTQLPVKIPPNLSAGLRALCKREQVTLFMSALAVFAALLHRYTEQTDITVGTPIAGRNRAELEPLIGLFVNTLVLRLDVSGDPSFRELVKRVKQTATNALDHQDTPFDALVGEFQPERDLGKNPLFQVLFQVFTPPRERTAAAAPDGEDATTLAVDRGTAILDLAWHLVDAPTIFGYIEYSTELFDAATIERQFQHFLRLLTEVIAHPDRAISQLDLLSAEEHARLSTAWQGAERIFPAAAESIPASFAARVAAAPDAVALLAGETRVTFAELAARSAQLANHLHDLGVAAGDRVAICLERSPDMVAAALAAMQIGAAFVPLDPAYPELRLRDIVEHSRARALITTTALLGRVPPGEALPILLDSDETIAAKSTQLPAIAISPLDAAYVIYTSGSTGRPKGVIGLHGSTLNRFAWMWDEFPFAPGEVACQKTAISFVDSIWETFGPLLAGVPLLIVPENAVRDARALVALLAEHRVTRFLAVPSLLEVLLDSGIDLGRELPNLRLWLTSGEALRDELMNRFRARVPKGTLVNLYGASEVAADVTFDRIDPADATTHITIGRPIANCRAYVLDRSLHLVPPGIAGDLYIAGPNLGRGYLHQPAMTAERFLADPFADEPGTRMYATGDRARHLPDGRLEYLGRTDHQIKLRGHRIELGDVEAALREHPHVRQAVAGVRDDGAGGRLVAWLVADSGLNIDELRAFVASRLPVASVPGTFVIVDDFPLTPSGKLDRIALAARDHGAPAGGRFIAPSTEAEIVLAGLWSELLRRDSISTSDNFFEIGGHSLLAIRLVSRIRDNLGVELPLTDVFLYPTLGGQAHAIEQRLLDELDALSDDEARERLQIESEEHVH
jgi:amino acid adenylation domain-containing protein